MKSEESDTSTLPGGEPDSSDAQAFVSDLIRTYPREVPFSAQGIVERFPQLAGHRSCLIDLAYEEFCRLREAGDNVSPTQFAGQYRDIEHSLHRVIEFDQIIHQHPSYINSVPDEQWPVPGHSFCGLHLIELIGRGVLSRVFVARQSRLGNRHTVAKICARGEQEANLLGKLNHPAIAGVYSIDTHPANGLSVICMPYVTRATLHHVAELLRTLELKQVRGEDVFQIVHRINSDDAAMADHRRSPDAAVLRESLGELILRWGETLADALQFAHEGGILHCDVKPGNVLVLPDLSVQLLDFNLASTATGGERILGGTMPYMASEQLLYLLHQSAGPGSAEPTDADSFRASPATDIFGLCATLWHLATGHPPFGVGTDSANRMMAAREVLTRQQNGVQLQSPELQDYEVPEAVLRVLATGLQADRDQRPASAADLARLFREARMSLAAADTATAAGDQSGASVSDLAGGLSSPNHVFPGGMVLQAEATESLRTEARVAGNRQLRRLSAVGGFVAVAVMLGSAGMHFLSPPPPAASTWQMDFQGLMGGGQLELAGELLSGQLKTSPGDDELRYELARLLIQRKLLTQASEILTHDFSASGSAEQSQHSGLRFLRLYLQTVMAAAPVEESSAEGSSGVASESPVAGVPSGPKMGSELGGLMGAWQQLADTAASPSPSTLSTFARLNLAAVALEIDDLATCRSVLEKLPSDAANLSPTRRIQDALTVLEAVRAKSPVPEVSLQRLEQVSYAQMTRSESRALLTALVSQMTAPGAKVLTEGNSESDLLQRFEAAVVAVVPAHVQGSCLKYVLHRPEFRIHRLLLQRIAQIATGPAGETRNQLEHLLLLPPSNVVDDSGEMFSPVAELVQLEHSQDAARAADRR